MYNWTLVALSQFDLIACLLLAYPIFQTGGGDTFEWDELEDDFIVDLGEEEDFGSAIKDYGWGID